MSNPNVALGTINRLLASVVWDDFPALNITPSYLAPEAIDMTLEGVMTTMLPTMTGFVTSGEPWMPMRLVVHLVRSQALAASYKTHWEQSTLMGSATVRPDVPTSTLPPFIIDNVAITNLNTLNYSGREAGFVVTFMGQYQINQNLWP
jgi:hypothetical protein